MTVADDDLDADELPPSPRGDDDVDDDDSGTPSEESAAPSEPEAEVRMTFVEHLEELRKRLLWSLYGLLPAFCVAWYFREQLVDIIARPLVVAYTRLHLGTVSLHALGLADPVSEYLKLCFFASLLASAPWIFWNVWAFIAPGLYSKEKRYAIPFVFFSTLCFIGGALFGYYVVFPLGFATLLGFSGTLPSGHVKIVPTLTFGEYLDFSAQLSVAFGAVFEVPVVIAFLSMIGVVDWRQLMRFGRWWVVISAIASAVLTPSTDIGTQLAMLIPLIVLYYIGVVLAFFLGRRKPAAAAS